MLGFDNDDRSARLKDPYDRISDLGGETLLHLRAACENIDKARQFRQSGDLTGRVGDVADVGDSVKRQQMVFAGAVELDVFDDHELLVPHIKHRRQDVFGILSQSTEHLCVTSCHTLRSFAQSIAVGVFSYGDQQLTDRGGDGVSVVLPCRGTGVGAHWIDGHASIY